MISILEWVKLPETINISDLDTPSTSALYALIISRKSFLKRLYKDFYMEFKKSVPNASTKMFVELGSGGGFIKDVIPEVVTSDILPLKDIDISFSAEKMPFRDGTIDAFFMLNVFHHVKRPVSVLNEFNRYLKIGGKVVMIEPANTLWGRFIYKNFHHEPFDSLVKEWEVEGTGPLSGANSAMPWIIFFRDRLKFEREYPKLKVKKIKFHTPFRYLISGGFSIKQLLPSFTYNLIKGAEIILSPINKYIGMFFTIEIEKVP